MEFTTIQKYIHTSPRKLRLVADMVRKMKPASALVNLQFTNKAAAEPLAKAIKTVLANAKQQNASVDSLVFKSIEINESVKLKRHQPQARGRVNPFKKRMSHIKVVLAAEVAKEEKNGKKS